MNIVLLSNHVLQSRRKAGFHHLATALHELGHTITFATVGFSAISYLRNDFRTKIPNIRKQFGKHIKITERLYSFIHFTWLHPHTVLLPIFDAILAPYIVDSYDAFDLKELVPHLAKADMIIYESCAAICLFKKCKQLAPTAQHVYRVSDDIGIMGSTPPRMLELEHEIAPDFDLISVPYQTLAKKFKYAPACQYHGHGLQKELFNSTSTSPYTTQKNCVYVGVGFFDAQFIAIAAKACPNVHFHLIGPLKQTVQAPNVHWYGEMPFVQTIPYLKHADVGLQILSGENIKIFQDTLKIIQYRYCELPIVTSKEMPSTKEGFFYYTHEDTTSIPAAIHAALASGNSTSRASEVQSWHDIARKILTSKG